MKKKATNNFSKFAPKKSNAAIKEQFKQEKRKFKKEREEFFEKKKEQMKELMKKQKEQMKSILTEEQMKKLHEGRKQGHGGMHGKKPGKKEVI